MNKIIWSRWKDPMAALVARNEDEDDPDFRQAISTFGFEEDESDQKVFAYVGPSGIIPVIPPSDNFNLWVGDTNFDLRDHMNSIEKVPGVELFEFLTRYRFRMAIGRAFKESEVKAAVEKVVNPSASRGIPKIAETLNKQFPCWAVYRLANGSLAYSGGASKTEVLEKGKRHGVPPVIVSWETNS